MIWSAQQKQVKQCLPLGAEMSPDTPGVSECIRVDQYDDTVNALEHAVAVASTLDSTPLNWKWLLIAVHNALQGALVCTLSGSHGTGALTEKSMAAIWDWYEAPSNDPKTNHPKEWLAPPLDLYARAKEENYMGEFGGNPVSTTPEQDNDVRKLNELRRGFAHYTPRLWSIEIAGLPRIVLNVIEVIEGLLRHPAFSYRLKEEQMNRARQAIKHLRETFCLSTERCAVLCCAVSDG